MHTVTLPAPPRNLLPPGPRSPAIIQGINLVARPTEYLQEIHDRYGDHVTVSIPRNRAVIMTRDPETIQAVFRGDPDTLHAGEGNRILKPVVGTHSVLLLDGERHRRDRKLMSPMFHGDRMRAYGETMQQVAEKAFRTILHGKTIAIHEVMQAITLDVILMTVFGIAENQLQRFRDALVPFMELGATPILLLGIDEDGEMSDIPIDRLRGHNSLVNQVKRRRQIVHEMLENEINNRRGHTQGREDVLSLLVDAKFDDGSQMSTEEVRDELLTLLVAGHETSATSLTWLVAQLAAHPHVTAKMRDEVAQVGNGKAVPNERVNDLRYTFAVVKETLRRRPILPIVMRRVQEDIQLGNLFVPKGGQVAPAIYASHHSEKVWGDPYAFRPERFEKSPKPWYFFPFGGGNRTCLGMAFAYYEMKIVAAEWVRLINYKLAPGYKPNTVRRNITLAPAQGVPLKVTGLRA